MCDNLTLQSLANNNRQPNLKSLPAGIYTSANKQIIMKIKPSSAGMTTYYKQRTLTDFRLRFKVWRSSATTSNKFVNEIDLLGSKFNAWGGPSAATVLVQ